MKKLLQLGLGAVVMCALASQQLNAQQINQSDITGPGTTGSTIVSGAFSPSATTVTANPSPSVTTAIAIVGTAIVSQLLTGAPLPVTTASGAVVNIPVSVQATVLAILTEGVAPPQFVSALASGGDPSSAAGLAASLQGLISSPTPGQLSNAITQFNALIAGSSDAFVSTPPAEFLAVHLVLGQMVSAAQSVQ